MTQDDIDYIFTESMKKLCTGKTIFKTTVKVSYTEAKSKYVMSGSKHTRGLRSVCQEARHACGAWQWGPMKWEDMDQDGAMVHWRTGNEFCTTCSDDILGYFPCEKIEDEKSFSTACKLNQNSHIDILILVYSNTLICNQTFSLILNSFI